MTLQDRLGSGIGFLQINAPVLQLLKRDRHPCHSAAHEGARPHDAEITIEVFYLSLAVHRRRTVIAVEQQSLRFQAGVRPNIVVRPRQRNPRISAQEPNRLPWPAGPSPPPRPRALFFADGRARSPSAVAPTRPSENSMSSRMPAPMALDERSG